MGIKLMVEIFDHWQDAGLTAGERSDLLVLAENANDGTRLTFGPVHAEYILRRAGKSANGWKNAVGKLVAKKVLTVHTPGRIKQAAVYRLERLCPESRHDGHKGACRRSSDRVTPEVTLSEKEGHLSDDPMGHPSGDPVGQEGHLTGAERVTSQVTPTPPYPSFKTPSTTSSTSPAEVPDDDSAVDPNVTDGGGGSDLRSIAEEITAALDYRGKPPGARLRQTIEDRLTAALTAGWSVNGLAVVLDIDGQDVDYPAAVYSHRLDPDELPPTEPASDPAAARRDTADGGMWERAMDRAQQRMAGVGARSGTDATVAGWDAVKWELAGREHQPYSNPVDDSIYDEPWTIPAPSRPPWCGDPGCSETDRMRDGVGGAGFKFAKPCDKCHPDRVRAA